MNYTEYKEIERKANEIGFALAKVVNNFCDVLTTTGLNDYISKGDLLNMLYFDGTKNMIKLKPNYRALIFDAVNLSLWVNGEELQDRQNQIAQAVRNSQPKQNKNQDFEILQRRRQAQAK